MAPKAKSVADATPSTRAENDPLKELMDITKQTSPLIVTAVMGGKDIWSVMPVLLAPIAVYGLSYVSVGYDHLMRWAYPKKIENVPDYINYDVINTNDRSNYYVNFVEQFSLFATTFFSDQIKTGNISNYQITNIQIPNTNDYLLNPYIELMPGFSIKIDFNKKNQDGLTLVEHIKKQGLNLKKEVDLNLLASHPIYVEILTKTVQKAKYDGTTYEFTYNYVLVKAKTHEMAVDFVKLVIAYSLYCTLSVINFRLKKVSYSVGKDNKDEHPAMAITNFVTVEKTYQNIFLSEKNTHLIQDNVTKWMNDKDDYIVKGIPHKLGFLLYGKPGNGKSSLIYAVANETKKHIYSFNLENFTNIKFINTISKLSNSIIVFEDFDANDVALSREEKEKKRKAKANKLNKFGTFGQQSLQLIQALRSREKR